MFEAIKLDNDNNVDENDDVNDDDDRETDFDVPQPKRQERQKAVLNQTSASIQQIYHLILRNLVSKIFRSYY